MVSTPPTSHPGGAVLIPCDPLGWFRNIHVASGALSLQATHAAVISLGGSATKSFSSAAKMSLNRQPMDLELNRTSGILSCLALITALFG